MSVGTWASIQREPGVRILVDHNTFFENATVVEKVNAATAKVIEEKPEQLRRFTAAIVKTARHFAENQEAWVAAITKRRAKLERADAVNLWNGFRTSWAVNGLMNLETYRKTSDFYYQNGWRYNGYGGYGGYGGYYGGYAPAYYGGSGYAPTYSYSYPPSYYGYAPAYYAPSYYNPRRYYRPYRAYIGPRVYVRSYRPYW
jgi:hypothetical protein